MSHTHTIKSIANIKSGVVTSHKKPSSKVIVENGETKT